MEGGMERFEQNNQGAEKFSAEVESFSELKETIAGLLSKGIDESVKEEVLSEIAHADRMRQTGNPEPAETTLEHLLECGIDQDTAMNVAQHYAEWVNTTEWVNKKDN